ncbi:MAG: hypothetical protein M0R70_05575 [Nitrospirae bacterium]|nr:hypothetical protein [Nitrospirota bacterium]
MNKSKTYLLFAVMIAALAACTSNLNTIVPPIEDVLHAGPLSKIVVYVGNVPLGESGPSADGLNLSIGGTAYLSAQGRDANNRPIKVTPRWQASRPELLEVSPIEGEMVAIRGLREGTAELVAEYAGVKHTVNYIFIK